MGKFRLRIILYIITLFLIVGFVGLTCFNSWVQIYNNITSRKNLEVKYDELINTEDELSDEVNKLQDPEYVAKYAREKYLYTKEGEIVIDVSSY